MPLPVININDVSMDYFLRGVDAAKPQEVQPSQDQPSQVPQEGAKAQVDQTRQAVGKMVSQLDVLLMKAAMASTKGLDGKTLKTSLKTLVDKGHLAKDSLKLIAKTADAAAKTLKTLDGFTGKELADAIVTKKDDDGKQHDSYNLATAAGRAVSAAVKAQRDLSDLLSQVGKIIFAHIQGKDAEGEKLLDEVNEFTMLCDRRMFEIDQLAWQMKDFAVYLASNEKNGAKSDPNITAILKAKAKDLLPRQALAMHGTADALATVSKKVSEQLRPLAEKIDAFRSNPSAAIGEANFNELQHDIATMKAALKDIRENGVEIDGDFKIVDGVKVVGKMVVAKDIIKALEAEVATAEKLFKTAREEVAGKVLKDYIATAKSLLFEDGGYEKKTARDASHQKVFECRQNFMEAMRKLAAAAVEQFADTKADDGKKSDALKPLVNTFIEKAKELVKAARNAKTVKGSSGERLDKLFRRLKHVQPLARGFELLVDKVRSGDKELFSGAWAMSIFNGGVSASSIIEARARGMEHSDVDPANDDANIVSERLLGSGAAGSVFELTRSDGNQVIFKGEAESRTGLSGLAAGDGNQYAEEQTTANLNIASKNAAKALGMGDLIVDYSVGTHKGIFGFYMEKAKGMTAAAMVDGDNSDDGISGRQIQFLPVENRIRIKADIRRELNRLQWLDLVTGQADRHAQNYFIHVDSETLKVTVKGIDNDAGYSQYRTGAVTFSFDAKHSDKFKASLREIARQIDKANTEKVLENLLKDPGIKTEMKKEGKQEVECYTVDASKIENKAIAHALVGVTGVQTLAVPDKIDRETYDALIALKSGPNREAYLDSIRPRLSEQSFNAAVSRLDDIIKRAEQLGKAGKIVEKDGWIKERDEVPLQKEKKIAVQKPDGAQVQLGGKVARFANTSFCPSIFARDKLDSMFS